MADDVLLNKAAIIKRCCEAAIDLAMHVTRKQRLGLPQDAREAFTLLEKASAVTPDLATRMRAMVGFRNIAVHQYQELSIPILHAVLDERLDDFNAFTQVLIRRTSTNDSE